MIKKVHINMCPILYGYGVMGIFNPRTRPRVNRVSRNQLAGDVLNLVAYLLRCQHYFRHLLAQFKTERQPVLRPTVAFPKTSFKHRSIQIKGNFTKLTLHSYFKMYHVLCWFIILFRLLSIIFTFSSKFQAVITP